MINIAEIHLTQIPDWIATILVGLVAGGWGVFTFFKSKEKKELSYSIIANNSIANVHEELPQLHKIKISVGEKSVRNIRFVLIRVQNTGNVTVESDDLELPVCFVPISLIENQQLIGGYVSNTDPYNAIANVMRYEDVQMVGLTKFSINKRDKIDIALLFADYDEDIIPIARIKGGIFKYAEAQDLQATFWSRTWFVWLIIHLALAAFLSVSLWIFSNVNFVKTFIILLLSLLAPTYLFLLNNWRKKKQQK